MMINKKGNDGKAEKPWCASPLIPAESQNNIFAASLFRSGKNYYYYDIINLSLCGLCAPISIHHNLEEESIKTHLF